MTIFVGNKLIEKISSLSELTCQTLAYIDGGNQWLSWAIQNPMVNYKFSDESSLLGEVQVGLHGSPMTLLPKVGL